MIDFVTFTKIAKNVGDLGKLIVAKGFKKLPKVQKITKSGHTCSFGLAEANVISFESNLTAIVFHFIGK